MAMITKSDILLSIRNLVVEYSSEGDTVHAVNCVELDLEKGKTLGLVGETGAGKTTIAKAILQILPEPQGKITDGEICFDTENLMQFSEKQMRKIRGNKISMIFQDPMTALNPTMRIGDQIAEAIGLHSDFTKKEAKIRAAEMLEKVGIPAGRYADYPHQFSGGMKQRVIIAIALACSPQVLLADEPTSALDVTIQAQVLDMIIDLKEKLGMALIMITHDLGVVAKICDSVAIMYAGKIVEYGTLREIFREPKHPYTEGLFNSLPNVKDRKVDLKPIPGFMPDPTKLPLGCSFAPRCQYAVEDCEAPSEMYTFSETHTVLCTRYSEADFKIERVFSKTR